MDYFNYQAELCHSLMNAGETPNALQVIDAISPEMLTGQFAEMFSAIKDLHSKGLPFTVIDVAEKLKCDYIDLLNINRKLAASPHAVKSFAKRVRQGYMLNKTANEIGSIIDEINGCSDETQIGDIAARLEKAVAGMEIETDDKKPRLGKDILEDYLEVMDQKCKGIESAKTIKTGMEELDRRTGGFDRTDLIILSGASGMGKTELLINILSKATDENNGALMFSMEMDEQLVISRALAIESNLSAKKLRNPQNLSDEDWARISNGSARIINKKIYVLDQTGLSCEQIAVKARQHKAENPDTRFIMIDYVGLIKLEGTRRNDIELGDVSRKLKSLAGELQTPIILLTQVTTKEIVKRPDKRPLASDLKDSSRLQDDADWIIFTYRDSYYNEESQLQGLSELLIRKSRNGETGTVYQASVNGHYMETDQAKAYQMYESSLIKPDRKSRKDF